MQRLLPLLLLAACSYENPQFVPTTMDLPIVRLTTEAPIVSKDEYVSGSVTIGDFASDVQMKGHGNSTWNLAKKPYKMKLAEKAEMLDMPSGKDFVLIANHLDKTLIRTAVAFAMSEQLGLAFTPRSRFVELFLNDRYEGVYQLTEQIKVAKKRVNISDEGFLLEIEPKTDDHPYVSVASGITFAVKEPEPASDEQLAAITAALQNMEDALGTDSIGTHLDLEAAIRWYWVQELLKNPESGLERSVYLFKETGKLITFGPVWDFDLSGGNVYIKECQTTDGFWVRRASWFAKLFEDPAFAEKAKAVWKTIDVPALLAKLDETALQLAQGEKNNFERWTILGVAQHGAGAAHGTHAQEVAAYRKWIETRAKWIDAQYQ